VVEIEKQIFLKNKDVATASQAKGSEPAIHICGVSAESSPKYNSSMVLHYSSRKLQKLSTRLTTVIKPGVYRGDCPGVGNNKYSNRYSSDR